MKNSYQMFILYLVLALAASTPSFSETQMRSNTENKNLLKEDSNAVYEQGKKLYDQKKYKEAFPLLLKAAESGNSEAQMHVGKMYYNGWGVAHSHEKGRAWHEKAAQQGNKESIQKIYNMDHHSESAH